MQENKKYEISKLDWDTEYFGIDSCKVVLKDSIKKEDINEVVKLTSNYAFMTIVNNENKSNNNRMISYTGAFLVDINMQFIKEVSSITFEDSNVFICNNCQESQAMLDIAKKSYKYSRFLNDSNLDANKASLIYYNWLKNSFNNEKKYIASFNENDLCKGYCLFHFEKDDSCVIELIAVDTNVSNKGIGSKIIKSVENFCYSNNIKLIKVGTQLENIEAQNFYIKNGYKIFKYNSIYHMWRNK